MSAPTAAAAAGLAARPDWTLGHAPVAPFAHPRTAVAPGIGPLDPAAWFHLDDDFAGQMRLRDALIAHRADWAFDTLPEGEAAAKELLEEILIHLGARSDYLVRPDGRVRRPDGAEVDARALPPIAAAGRLVQDDLLIMAKAEGEEEHRLVSGVLCFPAHWTLSEKMGRALLRIHLPVPEYPGDLARRVQRFFDGVQPGRPLWRANWHFAAGPDIVTPMKEVEKTGAFVSRLASDGQAWLRVERQTVLRLPRTRAVVFGVRTIVTPADGLSQAQWRDLHATLEALPGEMASRKVSPSLRARAAAEAARHTE
ncbi:MAG: DUF3445 domain-containing protein [Pseudomonadota bacterium]|nr:DUF3445 domain-containing protein [Pseudomonadota bacterium]MEE3099920.1 DUF3445 domain-containing protein [Pseudomonadota bacterium]